MKKLIFIAFLAFHTLVYAQNNNIHIGEGTLEPTAVFQADAIDRGMLVPRMTSTQRNSINSPASGLLVYDNSTQTFWYYDAAQWVELAGGGGGTSSTSHKISDADNDTKVHTESTVDEDIIRIESAGIEQMMISEDLIQLDGAKKLLIGSSASGAGSKFFYDDNNER